MKRHIALLAFLSFLGPFGGNMILSILHRLTVEFDAGIVVISLSLSLFMVPFAVLQLVAGPLSDLWDRRKTLMAGLVVFIAGLLISGFAPSVHLFLAGRTISGLGFAFVMPVTLAIAGDIVPASRRGGVMGWMGSMNMLGVALGPLIGGILAEIDWRLAFFALALMVAVGLTMFSLSSIGGARVKAETIPLRRLFQDAAGNRGLVMASLSGFLAMFAYVTALTSLSPYLAGAPFGFPDSRVGAVIACAGLGGIVISPVAGWIADRIGRAITSALGLAAVAAIYATLGMAGNWPALAVLFFALGGAMGFCWAGLMTLSVELLPSGRGTSASIFNFARFFGYAVAPQVSSFIFVRAGMQPVFLTAALGALAAALLAAYLKHSDRALHANCG